MKNGSKTDFYKWIDDIKKAYRHKEELEEKLKFYESRLVGYNAVTYDHVGSGTSKNNVENNLLYVIDKIEKVNKNIERCKSIIERYNNFKNSLNNKQYHILTSLIETNMSRKEIAKQMKLSRSRFYQLINQIEDYTK
ncbi:hypothetical protein HF295_04695 [Hujiaoplasma nucleasis]|uniref:RNA polymerase Rpb1 domain-containing protein n=1 Tax=Hujiaoplasma nucleasis TaxID=2725268 RepID=A0A7L6N4M9_9MOLU|nr:hypothetical protein [Hujiaoplasma nucleasis]QLY40198.1 hypothetical protein HF295_04695 [Hujiaoplasma nucleasis]